MFRPQCFSHSRRFTPPLTFVGLFHPTTTSRIYSSGVFPAAQPARLIDESYPHVVFRKASTTELPQWRQILSVRLQGVNPGSDPLRPTDGLDLTSARSPLGLSLPRAFLRTPWRRLHAPSVHDLSLPNTRSILSSRPTTYQSVLDLALYPQRTFPSKICDLPVHEIEITFQS